MWGQSEDCGCGAPAFRVIRARASDGTAESTHDCDRSTGVAINVKLAGIGTSRRLLRYRPQAVADYADCAVK